MKRAVLFALLLATLGCQSPTDPEPTPSVFGRLVGTVTIGPICPVEQQGQVCPTPPSAYAARKVLIYNSTRERLLFTVDIDDRGFYLINLAAPASYVVDIRGVGIDRSNDVPRSVDIRPNLVTRLDINIDTGIR